MEIKKEKRGGVRPGSGRPRMMGEQRHISIRIDAEDYKRLHEEAEKRGMAFSDYIRYKLNK